MSDRDDLLTEIRTVLPAGGTVRIEQSELDDLFEAYVLTGLVRAAQAESWSVSLHDMNELPANVALFRRSPGNIYASADSQNFTHFLITRAGVPPLEAHIGIKVTGKSDVEHECDVALLPQDAARFCRLHRVHPRSSRLILSAECKYLADNVPLYLGRGFVGLVTELTSQYGECHFVVNTSSSHVMKMLARQKRRRHEDVRPGTGRFETLQAACRETLLSYFMRERI
jgi:hypothetical protein